MICFSWFVMSDALGILIGCTVAVDAKLTDLFFCCSWWCVVVGGDCGTPAVVFACFNVLATE